MPGDPPHRHPSPLAAPRRAGGSSSQSRKIPEWRWPATTTRLPPLWVPRAASPLTASHRRRIPLERSRVPTPPGHPAAARPAKSWCRQRSVAGGSGVPGAARTNSADAAPTRPTYRQSRRGTPGSRRNPTWRIRRDRCVPWKGTTAAWGARQPGKISSPRLPAGCAGAGAACAGAGVAVLGARVPDVGAPGPAAAGQPHPPAAGGGCPAYPA